MPTNLISCVSLPPATRLSVPNYDYAEANEELVEKGMEEYLVCCGKSICGGCAYSFCQAGIGKCPFCNSERFTKTNEQEVEEIRRRVEANDPTSTCLLANCYHHGLHGFQQDHTKAIELYAKAANLGHSDAHYQLARIYRDGGDLKKAKLHYENAAIAGHEESRYNLGFMEVNSRNMERAIKHWKISASAGHYDAMFAMITLVKKGHVSKESINSTLAAYNNSCVQMRSEARDAYIRDKIT
jgi:tetratricopeptide (TPR) repeat protein